MKNHCYFAISRYPYWFSALATIVGVVCIFELCLCIKIILFCSCVILSFIIPYISSLCKKTYSIKTIGNSKVSVEFGDIFDEDCFVVTTTRNFDVDPTGEFISEISLLGAFVHKFYREKVADLEDTIRQTLQLEHNSSIKPMNFGDSISLTKDNKMVYLLAFTDREKKKQPKDFYIKSIRKFLDTISQANHGKTIAFPLIGDNNNLSNTGFSSSEVAFESLVNMINEFGIENPTYTLKIKIVILPNKRSEVIKTIAYYSKLL